MMNSSYWILNLNKVTVVVSPQILNDENLFGIQENLRRTKSSRMTSALESLGQRSQLRFAHFDSFVAT